MREGTTKRQGLILRLLGASLALAGAGVAWAGAEARRDTAPAPNEVRIGYFANVTHAQAVLGIASGDFDKALAPAKVTTRVFNAGPSLIEALFADEIDIGYVGPSPALNAHLQSRGKGIRVVAGAAANGVVIVAAPKSGIKTLEDLKGKRVATPQLGNTQDLSARHYLTKVLGEANADNVLPVPNAEQATMMSRGQIDAAWAVEPWGARLVADCGGTIVAEEKELWPDKRFVLTLVVVSPGFLSKHADIVERALGVHCAWTQRLASGGAKYVPELAGALEKVTGKKLPERVIADSLSRVQFTDNPLPESMNSFARWAYDLGLSRGVPNVATLVDTRILERVRAGTKPEVGRPGEGQGDGRK